MELIIWRHADAEPGEPDLDRELTAKGRKQALKMAQWLDQHLPSNCRILSSPAARTLQTVQALERKFKIVDALAPDSDAAHILTAVNWPQSREPVLIVGHQPTLGRVISLLITGVEQDWTLRKSSVCWIAQKAEGEAPNNYIKAMMAPDMLSK